jgi:lysophospholipase L1-like esterase
VTITLPTLEERTRALPASSFKRSHRPWWRPVGEFVALSCVAIVSIEALFHAAGIGEQEFVQPDSTFGCVHIPDKLVTWRLEGYSHDRLSHQGLRDSEHQLSKAPGVTRIALLGDSTTESLQVPLAQTYGKVLERLLNDQAAAAKNGKRFEVINFGCASYSTGQELLCYEKQVRQFQPDIVVLMYNRGDASENVLVAQRADQITPRPYFHLDSSQHVAIDRSVMDLYATQLRPNPILSFLRGQSSIYGIFAHQNLMLSITEPLYVKIRRFWLRLPFSGLPKQATSWIKPAYPAPDAAAVTAALLKQLRQDVERDHAKFALLLFGNAQDPGYAMEEKQLLDLGREQNLDLLDLTQPFTNSATRKGLLLQNHLSSTGHKLVAMELFKNLVEPKHP